MTSLVGNIACACSFCRPMAPIRVSQRLTQLQPQEWHDVGNLCPIMWIFASSVAATHCKECNRDIYHAERCLSAIVQTVCLGKDEKEDKNLSVLTAICQGSPGEERAIAMQRILDTSRKTPGVYKA